MAAGKIYDSASGKWITVVQGTQGEAGPQGPKGDLPIVTSNTEPADKSVLWVDTSPKISEGPVNETDWVDVPVKSPFAIYNGDRLQIRRVGEFIYLRGRVSTASPVSILYSGSTQIAAIADTSLHPIVDAGFVVPAKTPGVEVDDILCLIVNTMGIIYLAVNSSSTSSMIVGSKIYISSVFWYYK